MSVMGEDGVELALEILLAISRYSKVIVRAHEPGVS